MDRKEGDAGENPLDFIGDVVGGRYKIKGLIKEKGFFTWPFLAHELPLDNREVMIKILRSGVDESRAEQLNLEAQRHAKLSKHPYLAMILNNGMYRDRPWIAEEYVAGKDLEELLESGEKFSDDRIASLLFCAADALCYLHGLKEPIEHNDVSPRNLKEVKEQEGICVLLDWGGRQTQDKDCDDVYALGSKVGRRLLDNRESKRRIPKGLEKIVMRAEKGLYESPVELREDIQKYQWWSDPVKPLVVGPGITRRRFGKVVTGVTAASVSLLYGWNYLDYRFNAAGPILDKIDETPLNDHESLAAHYVEIAVRLCNGPIRELYEKSAKKEWVPFATTPDKKWYPDKPNSFFAGISVDLLRNAAFLTEDNEFDNLADILASRIVSAEKEAGFNVFRFLHAGKNILNAARYWDEFYDERLGIYNLSSAFDKYFEQPVRNGTAILDTGSLTTVLPLMLAGAQLCAGRESSERVERLVRHTQALEKHIVREDGSTRDLALVDFSTGDIVEGKKYAWKPDGCYARGHVGFIDWMVNLFSETGDERYLSVGNTLQNHYNGQLPRDSVPLADISYSYRREAKPVLRDTSALMNNNNTLAWANYELGVPFHEDMLYVSLKASTPFIARKNNTDVLISEGCNQIGGNYTNTCPIWSVHSLLETAKRIKKYF